MSHPAQFSPTILARLRDILDSFRLPVHDPFAGPGLRLGRLCTSLGLAFSGTEIEPPFIMDPRVKGGDSTNRETYPWWMDYLLVTSPVYPNGMTDHFHAKDGSRRHTYRQSLAAIQGFDAPLHPNNMGRWGNAHRRSAKVEAEHWRIANECVVHWPEWVVVNVKDVVATNYHVHVTARWAELLREHGYVIVEETTVEVPSQRDGANGDLRADYETIFTANRLTV